MEIIIGKQGNQPFPLTEPSISRRHAVLNVDKSTGMIRLRDNNSMNGTWILSKDGMFRRLVGETTVSPETSVRLGASYVFKIKEALVQKPVDISSLKTVYENYVNNKLTLEAKSSNIMMMKMAAMTLSTTVVGSLFLLVLPKDFFGNETISNIVKGLITIISVVAAYMLVDLKSKKLIKLKNQNEQYLKNNYCCPKCGYHFGSQKVFANLLAEGRCPNNSCKCKFEVKQ